MRLLPEKGTLTFLTPDTTVCYNSKIPKKVTVTFFGEWVL